MTEPYTIAHRQFECIIIDNFKFIGSIRGIISISPTVYAAIVEWDMDQELRVINAVSDYLGVSSSDINFNDGDELESKYVCITENTNVTNAEDGSTIPIRDLDIGSVIRGYSTLTIIEPYALPSLSCASYTGIKLSSNVYNCTYSNLTMHVPGDGAFGYVASVSEDDISDLEIEYEF